MSYILDALKRADAERERGVVPGLYARHVTSVARDGVPATSRLLSLAAIAALALVAIAAGFWVWHASNSAPEPARVEVMPPAPVSPPSTPSVAAPVAQTAAPPVAPAVPATSPRVPAAVAPAAATAKAAPAAAAPVATTAQATPGAAAPVARAERTTRASSAAVPLLAELPEELRRQVPALSISGALYSDNPAERVLLVNNQVSNEGSHPAPGVTLEEIGTDSSLFSFRGARFRLAH